MTPRLSLLYTTFANEADAIKISRELLENRLVACINLLEGMRSLYFWEGALEESLEVIVF